MIIVLVNLFKIYETLHHKYYSLYSCRTLMVKTQIVKKHVKKRKKEIKTKKKWKQEEMKTSRYGKEMKQEEMKTKWMKTRRDKKP